MLHGPHQPLHATTPGRVHAPLHLCPTPAHLPTARPRVQAPFVAPLPALVSQWASNWLASYPVALAPRVTRWPVVNSSMVCVLAWLHDLTVFLWLTPRCVCLGGVRHKCGVGSCLGHEAAALALAILLPTKEPPRFALACQQQDAPAASTPYVLSMVAASASEQQVGRLCLQRLGPF